MSMLSDDWQPKTPSKQVKPLRNKITLIFDLDETLITAVETYSPIVMTFGKYTFSTITYKFNDEDTTDIILGRPGTRALFDFLIENAAYFNVGFWSTGVYSRVEAIYKDFPQAIKDMTVLLIGRENLKKLSKAYVVNRDNSYYKEYRDYSFYDILSKKRIPSHKFQGNLIKWIDKLRELPEYRAVLDQNRTILIDDLPSNIIPNKSHQTIWVNPWHYNYTCDPTLDKLVAWLEKNKKRKSFARVKMPSFGLDSPFDSVVHANLNPLEHAKQSQDICDAHYANIRRKKSKRASKAKTASTSIKTRKAKASVSTAKK